MMKAADFGRFLLHGNNRRNKMTLARASVNSGWNVARWAIGKEPTDVGLASYAKETGIRAITSLFGVKQAQDDKLPAGWPADVFAVVAKEIESKAGNIKLEDGAIIPAFRLTTSGAVTLPHMWIAYIKPTASTSNYRNVLDLDDSIEESLSQKGHHLTARVMGKPLRVEIERPSADIITLGTDWELWKTQPVNKHEYIFGTYFGRLGFGCGIADLIDPNECHAAVIGMTGSGKSQLSLGIMLSLAMNTSPAHLSMIVIDPKGVDFAPLATLPHLANGEVLTTLADGITAVRAVVAEMDRRVALKDGSVANNRIFLFIDEVPNLLDLDRNTNNGGESLEDGLVRLLQMGRGVGINVFLAAQQAKKEVMSTRILENMSWRMVGSVNTFYASAHASGQDGCMAHKLPGKGSFLMYNPEFRNGVRVQSHFVADPKSPDYKRNVGRYLDDICERWAGIRPHWTLRTQVETAPHLVQPMLMEDVQDSRSQAVDFPFEFEMEMYQLYLSDKDKFSINKIRTAHKQKYEAECRNDRAKRLYTRIVGRMDA